MFSCYLRIVPASLLLIPMLATAVAAQPNPLAAAPVALSQDRPLPPGGESAISADWLETARLTGPKAGAASLRIVPVEGQSFQRALRIDTGGPSGDANDIRLEWPNVANIAGTDVFYLRFWARLVESTSETGEGRIGFGLTNGKPGGQLFFGGQSNPNRIGEWQRTSRPITLQKGAAAGGVNFILSLGGTGTGKQIVEIGGLELLNFGNRARADQLPFKPGTYEGRDPNAQWRKDALARIEAIRKGDLTVRVVDKAGRPVAGAQVKVEMKRHAFKFGTAIAARRVAIGQGADAERYREWLPKLFNEAVQDNAHKWIGWSDKSQQPITNQATQWVLDKGMTMRGHALVWPAWRFMPDAIKTRYDELKAAQGDAAAKTYLRGAVEDHIRDIVTANKGKLGDWDLINETHGNHDLMDILGREVMADWFKLAHSLDPNAVLYLNENSLLNGKKVEFVENEIKFLRAHGAPIGGLGLQGHVGPNVGMTQSLSVLDRLGKLGLKLKITEFDIVTPDDALQGDYTRDLLTLVFSHPATEGFVMWGFWDGAHWLGDAPIFYRDWTLKPSGVAWQDLVTRQWWTNAQGVSNALGAYQTRGFCGDYEVTVTHGGQTQTVKTQLTRAGRVVEVRLN